MSIRLLSFCMAFLVLGLVHLSASVRLARIAETRLPVVVATSQPFQTGSPIFSNEKITLSGLYPNPSVSIATLEYEMSGDIKEAKVTVTNVLGNTLSEHNLLKEMRKLQFSTSDYPPGVYFYTLSVEGKRVCTRKFIIRH